MSKKLREIIENSDLDRKQIKQNRAEFESFLVSNGLMAASIRHNPKTNQFKAHSVQQHGFAPEREQHYREKRKQAIATDKASGHAPYVAGPALSSVLRQYSNEMTDATKAHLSKHFGKHPALQIVHQPPSSDKDWHRVHVTYDPAKGKLT